MQELKIYQKPVHRMAKVRFSIPFDAYSSKLFAKPVHRMANERFSIYLDAQKK
jgi:hypothetical protein